MGKGPLFLNVMRGKVGNVVGYALKNSNNKEKQAFRAYVAQVSNPKTEPQAIQRLKLAPAVNFYRQLSRILDNAWQGQRYGNESRQHFMSLAMRQSTGIPFIVKGDKRFYPGEYPVAEGSLVRQSVTAISTDLLITSIVSPGISGTWGAVSQGLINKNFGIQDGDKLTFIFAGRNLLGEYIPAFSYVILDTSSTATAASVIASSNLTFEGAADAQLQVGVLNAVSDIVAGAVILSRLDQTSSTPKWLRSNARMFCSDAYKEMLMGTDAYMAAISSYMDSSAISSDWYLNAGITGMSSSYVPGGNSGSNLEVVSIARTSVNLEQELTLYVAIMTMSDGTKRVARTNTNPSLIVDYNQGTLSATQARANDARLDTIKAAVEGVTDWIVVNATGTVIETP